MNKHYSKILTVLLPGKYRHKLSQNHLNIVNLGNWTMENAKSMLHGWMNKNRIKADYKYMSHGPSHNLSFIAEMEFFVFELK